MQIRKSGKQLNGFDKKMRWYKQYDELIRQICPHYDEALDALVQQIPPNQKIIELGCGSGNLTQKLSEQGYKVKAYDNNKEMLILAKHKIRDTNVQFIKEDAENIEYQANDIIVSSLLFHLLSTEKRLEIFDRITKQSNSIYIFDRILGGTGEDERVYRNNFLKHIKYLPSALYEQLKTENAKNKPDKLSQQIRYFQQKGHLFEMIYQNPKYGFAAYSFIRK